MSFIEKIPNANVVILSLDSLLAEFWKLLLIVTLLFIVMLTPLKAPNNRI